MNNTRPISDILPKDEVFEAFRETARLNTSLQIMQERLESKNALLIINSGSEQHNADAPGYIKQLIIYANRIKEDLSIIHKAVDTDYWKKLEAENQD